MLSLDSFPLTRAPGSSARSDSGMAVVSPARNNRGQAGDTYNPLSQISSGWGVVFQEGGLHCFQH